MVIGANIFVRKDGKYWWLKRSAQKKSAPKVVHPIGGKLELNENPYLGAQRERLEEAGIKVQNMKLKAVLLEITPHQDIKNNWLIFHFSADYHHGRLKQTEDGDFVLLLGEEIERPELFPSVREVIQPILNSHAGTVFATISYNPDGTVNELTTRIDRCVL